MKSKFKLLLTGALFVGIIYALLPNQSTLTSADCGSDQCCKIAFTIQPGMSEDKYIDITREHECSSAIGGKVDCGYPHYRYIKPPSYDSHCKCDWVVDIQTDGKVIRKTSSPHCEPLKFDKIG